MHDMLRILDVASAMRRERETAEAQLDVDTNKAKLRERLLATAVAAGDAVTAAEVDAAIAQYFASQHRYSDPPRSWRRLRAQLWVLRSRVVLGIVLVALLVLGAAALAGAFARPAPESKPTAPRELPSKPPSAPVATQAPVATPEVVAPTPPPAPPPAPPRDPFPEQWQRFQESLAAARQLAGDKGAHARLGQVLAVAEAAGLRKDASRLRAAQHELDEVVARLEEQYDVKVVDRPGERSHVDRYASGRLTGYYVIVEAKTADGSTLRRRIVNHETKSRDEVTKWGEEVDEVVWNRLLADQRADGVVDEALFARKRRGTLAEDIVMQGADGKPLARGRSITSW
jgi:hypothetical protein